MNLLALILDNVTYAVAHPEGTREETVEAVIIAVRENAIIEDETLAAVATAAIHDLFEGKELPAEVLAALNVDV